MRVVGALASVTDQQHQACEAVSQTHRTQNALGQSCPLTRCFYARHDQLRPNLFDLRGREGDQIRIGAVSRSRKTAANDFPEITQAK